MRKQSTRDLKAAIPDNQPKQKSTTTYTPTVIQCSGLQVAPHNNQPIQQLPTMNTPLFSVLIANYNNGHYLMDAIESVRCQTYTHWEIVIVDDGSTDNSKTVYEGLKNDSCIRIFHNDENKGCGYTKRRCAELAKGELCCFLDADDALMPDALQTHADAHQQHPDVSCVFSRFYYCDNALNIVGELRKLDITPGKDYFTNRSYMPEHLTSFKRASYQKSEGIDPSLPSAVDQDLYFKLEEVAPVLVLEKFTYKYRQTSEQISQGNRWIETYYWNLIVRQRTCERRGLPPSQYPMQDLTDLVATLSEESERLQKENTKIQKSKAYRLGKFLLHPLKVLHKR